VGGVRGGGGLRKIKRPTVAYSTAGLRTALDETLCYVMIRRRMTPMGVPVTVHMVLHVLVIVVEIIRRRKFMIDRNSSWLCCLKKKYI
jgi:hypothetical protein